MEFNLVASLVAEQESGDSKCEALLADQAIREGKGIVDLGCTDAMGGERALDIVARKNLEKYGDTRLKEVNLEYQPVYNFGNGEKERAYGQVKFGLTGAGMQGDITINGFAKDVPILVQEGAEEAGRRHRLRYRSCRVCEAGPGDPGPAGGVAGRRPLLHEPGGRLARAES